MRFPWQRDATSAQEASTFVQLEDAAAVDAFFANASTEPSVLLIHDRSCGISARAYREAATAGTVIHLVLTGDGQHLSARVEAATRVPHESPQVFVLAGGEVRWHASHFRISRGAILDAMSAARATITS